MMNKRTALLALILIGGSCGAVYAQQVATAPAPRLTSGYLSADRMPDDLKLLPAPPAEGSQALKRDHDAEKRALALQGTPRWDLAKVDADIFNPNAANTMSCAAGLVIGPDTTPRLNTLLRRTMSDLGRASTKSKNTYNRPRPFVGNGQPICTPDQEAVLRGNGSYPSGHASIGYGWGLILGDLLPGRSRQLRARGHAFADSRRVCNVHFSSDIEAGEFLATIVVARLQDDAVYQADFAAARAELRTVPHVKPQCAAENAALRLH
jgi:acid phosphatase (class A)